MISQWSIEVNTAIITVEGIARVPIECVLVMEPFDILWLRITPRKYTKCEWLVLSPGKMLVALLEQLDRCAGERGQDEDDPFVRGSHVVHHPCERSLEPTFFQFLPFLAEEEVGDVRSCVSLRLIPHSDELTRVRIDLRVCGECRRRILAMEIICP